MSAKRTSSQQRPLHNIQPLLAHHQDQHKPGVSGETPLAFNSRVNDRLPPEILGEIFLQSLPRTLDANGRAALRDICLVCTTWRKAARQTHDLWAAVRIDYGRGAHTFMIGQLHNTRIAAWLGRAGAIAKSLEVLDIGNTIDFRVVAGLLRAVAPLITRLCLSFSSHFGLDQMLFWFDYRHGCSPWTEYPVSNLTLRVEVDQLVSIDSVQPWLLPDVPQSVKSLTLEIIDNRAKTDRRVTDRVVSPDVLQRLTELTMCCDPSLVDIAGLLKHCGTLESLSWNIRPLQGHHDLPPESEYDICVLPEVKFFQICEANCRSLAILNIIRMPRLSHVDINMDSGMTISTANDAKSLRSHWAHFLERHRTTITFLKIHGAHAGLEI